MATAQNVAEWMAAEVDRKGKLYQKLAIFPIKEKFGDEFVYFEKRHWSINQEVLEIFRKITGDKVVWVEKGRYWRLRQETDEPGKRLQRRRPLT
jgi:hypothetical protein